MYWDLNIVDEVKREMLRSSPIAHSLWGDEPYRWIDIPQSDQDIIYNQLLYDARGYQVRSQTRIPSDEWLVHYSPSKFNRFRGRDLSQIGNSIAGKTRITYEQDCDHLPLDKLDFLVQFAWSASHLIYNGMYAESIWNRNLVLFRSDSAVIHPGDSGEVIFRSCSERDITTFSYEGSVDKGGHPEEGGWISDDTGEVFDVSAFLDIVEWADNRFGLVRKWPLPIPGYFTSTDEIKIWGDRMIKAGWGGLLSQMLRRKLPEISEMTESDAIDYFNRYGSHNL